jgi:hypothetical protein
LAHNLLIKCAEYDQERPSRLFRGGGDGGGRQHADAASLRSLQRARVQRLRQELCPDQSGFCALERRLQIESGAWTVLLALGVAIATPLILPFLLLSRPEPSPAAAPRA